MQSTDFHPLFNDLFIVDLLSLKAAVFFVFFFCLFCKYLLAAILSRVLFKVTEMTLHAFGELLSAEPCRPSHFLGGATALCCVSPFIESLRCFSSRALVCLLWQWHFVVKGGRRIWSLWVITLEPTWPRFSVGWCVVFLKRDSMDLSQVSIW